MAKTYGDRINEIVAEYERMSKSEPAVLSDGTKFDWAEGYAHQVEMDKWVLEEALERIKAIRRAS